MSRRGGLTLGRSAPDREDRSRLAWTLTATAGGNGEHEAVVGARDVLEWIGQAGFACAAAWSRSYCVIAYVGEAHFRRRIVNGSLVEVAARVIATGRTSVHILVTVDVAGGTPGRTDRATHRPLVFVATDEDLRPRVVKPWESASLPISI